MASEAGDTNHDTQARSNLPGGTEGAGELDRAEVDLHSPRGESVAASAATGPLVHRAVKRPLLPYQYALCDVLGISEDDYHEFLAVQQDWTQSEEKRLSEVRNDAVTVAIVLTVIGILFQVAAVLLAPRPETPKGPRQGRNQRFSPRFGFNSTQELAAYGTPVPLVYCNRGMNPKGSVRVATSLLWSAVESFGSAQYMQLLLLVGAAEVKQITFNRIAFGQLPLGELRDTNTWVYYNATGGPVRFQDLVIGDTRDPAKSGLGNSSIVHQIKDGNNWRTGFSQALTPTSKTKFGCYNPIPINVDIIERKQSGKLSIFENGIYIQSGNWGVNSSNRWVKGDQVTIIFKPTSGSKNNLAREAGRDLRAQLIDTLDQGAVYILGSALFRAINLGSNRDLKKNSAFIILECIQPGRRPTTSYVRQRPRRLQESDLEKVEAAYDALNSSAYATQQAVNSILIEQNASRLNGSGVLTLPSRPREFEPSDEEQYEVLTETDIAFNFGDIRYDFSGLKTITWVNEANQTKSYTYYRGGSLKYTRRLLDQKLNDKPKLRTDDLRQVYDDQLEDVRRLRDAISAGAYDSAFRSQAKAESTAQRLKTDIANLRAQRRTAQDAGNLQLVDSLDVQIDDKQEERQDYLDRRVSEKQREQITFIRTTNSSFTGLDGQSYSCGIRCTKRKLNALKGDFVTDQVGSYAIKAELNDLIAEKEKALADAQYIAKNWEGFVTDIDDAFFCKCLVKAETAVYQTVTACDYVKLNIRARLFRRIQGRAKKYGKKQAPDGYRISDNGVKPRMAFFSIRFRETGGSWQRVPTLFAMSRAADNDAFITLKFETNGGLKKWEFEMAPVVDPAAEVTEHGYPSYSLLNTAGQRSRVTLGGNSFAFYGEIVGVAANKFPNTAEKGPLYTNEWDFFSVRSDTEMQSSADQGPEFELVNVTEQQKCAEAEQKYSDMSLLAIHTFSGSGVQDLRSVTAMVREGKRCWVVDEATGNYSLSNGSTSYAPDIFADTVLDSTNGITQYSNASGVDWESLALAKRFCKNSGLGCELFMDGVLAEQTSWRNFWVEAAPYSLLEFARVNGRETLVPAIPVTANGTATLAVTVSALFNQGNILQGSYKEEFLDYGDSTKDLVATVIYRDTTDVEAFARNDSVTVARFDTDINDAVWQTFDVSDWVSQREQAALYGRYLCQQRRWVKSAIEFKTVPSDSPVGPGDYIFVDIGLNRFDSIRTGVVEDGGRLNAPLSIGIPDGTYQALTYFSGGDVQSQSVSVSNGVASALASRAGALFSLGVAQTSRRTFRVVEVSMEESGETTIKAVEHPCDANGNSLVAKLNSGTFQEIGATCS